VEVLLEKVEIARLYEACIVKSARILFGVQRKLGEGEEEVVVNGKHKLAMHPQLVEALFLQLSSVELRKRKNVQRVPVGNARQNCICYTLGTKQDESGCWLTSLRF